MTKTKKKKKTNSSSNLIDTNFTDICVYSEFRCLDELEEDQKSKESFIAEFTSEEIQKYWPLVRHGIAVTTSVVTGLIDDNNSVSKDEIKKILIEVEKRLATEEEE